MLEDDRVVVYKKGLHILLPLATSVEGSDDVLFVEGERFTVVKTGFVPLLRKVAITTMNPNGLISRGLAGSWDDICAAFSVPLTKTTQASQARQT